MTSTSYKQENKSFVRHTVIREAVQLLTINRYEACCVRNSYVRDLFEYFLRQNETHEQLEAQKIDISYIRELGKNALKSYGNKTPR